MDNHEMSAKAHSVADDVSGQVHDVAAKASEQAQAAAKQVGELGSEALDQMDEWLKPLGLSIKENPMVTVAVLGGMAAAIGALWMSRSQKTRAEQVGDQLAKLARRASW